VGFDAEVVRRVHSGRSGGISKLSYVPAAIGAYFGYEYPGLEVTVDGVPFPEGAYQVVVANAGVYAGHFSVAPDASIDDGLLDVCLLYGKRRSLLRQGLRALRRRPLAARPTRHSGTGALTVRAKEVVIPGPPSAPVQIDGDPAEGLPLSVRVRPGALRVVVPEARD
jgi:diacylglycerol kinase family enzyme